MDKIIFFDGYCSLCNNLVDQMIRWDKNSELKFASLQGETARKILSLKNNEQLDPDTVIYWREGKPYDRSTAILMILRDLGGMWRLTSVFFAVPQFFRDLVYRFIAKIRYKAFGKRETCRLPNPQEKERLLP